MMKKTANDYIKNRLQPPKAFFEWCYYNMPTYVWKNQRQTLIASDRKHYFTKEKRLIKNSRLTFFDKKEYFMIILSTNKRIEIQTYAVCSSFENGKQLFSTTLENFEQLSQDQHIKISKDFPNGYKFGLKAISGMFHYYMPDIYPNEWRERLAHVSELKYLKLERIVPDQLSRIYKYRNLIEYAQAIGAEVLANEIINNLNEIDMRKVTMKWLKKNKVFFRKSQRGYRDYLLSTAVEKRGGKLITGVEQYLSYRQVESIPKQIGIVKFQNYLIKQGVQFSHYKDYLMMLKDLRIDLNKASLLPSDINKAHDKAVETLNTMKRKITHEGFKVQAKKLAYMEMSLSGFSFILPKTPDDLIQEGEKLHHCVGGSGYIGKHGRGESTIIFVRKNTNLKKSYFTIEYANKKIIQIQGKRNREKVPPELKQVVDLWLKEVERKKNGKKVA